MVLVAVAMIAIIAIAALSIDVITLYLAREEAQRSADAAALAAVRILSVSGMTGDPSNSSTLWSAVCGGSSSIASQAAQAVGTQNAVGGPVPTVSVTYSAPGGSQTADCTSLANSTFGVNPLLRNSIADCVC
jgi:type II secretory pathway pseudopilin PulG